MKIALIYPPFLRLFGGEMNSFINNLCQIGAVAKKEGHETIVYNVDYSDISSNFSLLDYQLHFNDYLKNLNDMEHQSWQDLRAFLENYSPDLLGVTCMTAHWTSVQNVAKIFKQLYPERPVIIGGHHPTAVPNQVILSPFVDYIVRGEGEITFIKLLYALETGKSIENINGISFKSGGKVLHNPDRGLINNLDDLPFVDLDLMYKASVRPYDYGMFLTARGCPYNCIFCASKLMWTRKPRFRSPEKVVEEILERYKKKNVTEFAIYDDTFTINKNHAKKVCDLIIKSGVKFKWRCMSTVKNRDVDFYKKLKGAGCYSISFGIETADLEGLKKIKKGTTIDEIKSAFSLVKNLGFSTKAFIMYGFPWEEKRHIKEDIFLLKKIEPTSLGYSTAVPLPGTELFELAREAGFLQEPLDQIDWSRYNQYSPVMFFSNKVSREEAYKLSLYAENEFYKINCMGKGIKGRLSLIIEKILGKEAKNYIKKLLLRWKIK